MVNTRALTSHLERHLPKVSRLEVRQDVLAARSAPAHQIGWFHQNGAGALVTARAAGQAIELLFGGGRRLGGRRERNARRGAGFGDMAQQCRAAADFSFPRLAASRIVVRTGVSLFEPTPQFDSLSGHTCACVDDVLRYQQYGVVPTECHGAKTKPSGPIWQRQLASLPPPTVS